MSMQFSFLCLLGSCLLLFAACKQQDQELIAKVETEIQTRQAELGQYEDIGARLEKFQQQVSAALPSQAGAPADSLKIKINAMVNREKTAIAAYKEYVGHLTDRLTKFRAGTADKKALELEYRAVHGSLGNMAKTFADLEEQYKQRQEEFTARQKQPTAR